MTRDDLVASALVLGFASFVTVHVTIVAGLALRRPRWRALVALAVAPMAPYWAAKNGKVARAALWGATAAAYLVLRRLAAR
jgi:hypothetical protein